MVAKLEKLKKKGRNVYLAVIVLFLLPGFRDTMASSLDVAPGGYGLSIGNSRRINGVRINLRDHHVERVNGLNLTVWKPKQNPDAVFNGAAIGLIGPDAKVINGFAIGLVGTSVRGKLRGIALGGMGAGVGKDLTGLAVGLLGVGTGGNIRGIGIGGLGVGAGKNLTGLAASLGGVGTGECIKGIALGGIGVGARKNITGLSLGLGGVGAGEAITGIALSVVSVGARDIKGMTVSGFNGMSIKRGRLKRVNERMTGLSIGLVNATLHLKGVQIGVINYAGNHPRWLRILPLINLHL